MATAEALLTAEEFYRLPDNGQPRELVRGRVVPVNVPYPRHGQICARVAQFLGNYAQEHDLGHVVSNDSGVITERGPDTVRGGDVAFYSYANLPRGPLPEGYLPVPPELILEVRSPTDRWQKVVAKVAEYLNAGVGTVIVLDSGPQTVHVYHTDQSPRILAADDVLELPDILPGLSVPIGRFFQ